MDFKKWLLYEIIELDKPSNRVRRSNIVKNAGTNTAYNAIQYRWETQQGNVIKLIFTPKGDDLYEVAFYVNDSIKDDAKSAERDSEILSSVFYLIKKKANELGAQALEWWAHNTEKDTKVIRGLQFDQQIFYKELENFKKALQNHRVRFLPLTPLRISLFQKLGREPQPQPDVDVEQWLEWVEEIEKSLGEKRPEWLHARLEEKLSNLMGAVQIDRLQHLNFNIENFTKIMEEYVVAVKSNTEQGLQKKTNRRANVYRRILNRYFADDWNIKISNNCNFYLTRKVT
jgi:hypothetical protein